VRPPNLQKSGQWKKQGVIRCPLNIALLASFIREKGNYSCSIVDFEIIPEEDPGRMAAIILAEKPRYVCFTTLTPRFPIVARIAGELKTLDPSVIAIVGGPHVTGSPHTSLTRGISYGVIGEGEDALLELLNRLESGSDPLTINNLVYQRPDTTLSVNPARPFIKDLDGLPLPAYDLMTLNEYTDPAYFEGSHCALFSSRGCAYDCKFCASCVTWHRKVRFRSSGNVIDEIKYIVNTLGVKNLMFWDDNFTSHKKRAIDICTGLIAENLGVKYTVQVRADNVDEELLGLLKRSGCQFAAIGVESGNEQMLVAMGKRETKDQIRNAIRMMRNVGLPSIASYIFGFPGDTHATIRETIDFAFELDADQSKFMILCPYPGTAYFELAKQRKLVDEFSFEQMESLNYYDSVAVNLSEVSNEDLIRYQDEAYARYDAMHGQKPDQDSPDLND